MKLPTQLTKLINYFQRPNKTANLAKERLQIIIAHERNQQDNPDYLAALQRDIVDVIVKYVAIDKEQVKVELDRQDGCSVLELNIVLPN